MTFGRLLWLEKHGWWQRRVLAVPDLPFESRGSSWKTTFETDRVIQQGGSLSGPTREMHYAEIKRVETGVQNAVQVVSSGKAPLLLHTVNDQFVIIALLAHHAPQAEFIGVTKMIRAGWEPRW